MVELCSVPSACSPTKARKATRKHHTKAGPTVSELIVKAVSLSKERSGMSLAALKKALAASGYDVEKNKARVKIAIKSLVNKGTLLHTKGTGASGSFKLNKAGGGKKKAAKKPAIKKAAGAKKRKTAAKKPAGTKKTPKKGKRRSGAKKTGKSPKKAKRSGTGKKASKSPKKARAARPKVAKTKTRKVKKGAHK